MKNSFEQSAPLPLIAMLLVAATIVIEQPTVRVLLILLIVLIVGITSARVLLRRMRGRGGALARHRIGVFRSVAGLIGIACFVGMLATQPTLRQAYPATRFTDAPGIAAQRGFYPPDTDTAGNRYVWTRDRGTLVFDLLVHKPVTFTVALRSAAIAGGPDAPVAVEVNGKEAGAFRPDPKNAQFQTFTLRLVPYDWGGEQTELRLVTDTFVPGKNDTRTLGTMVERVTVDTTEAWSSIGRRWWLLWSLPLLALLALGLRLLAQGRGGRIAGYGALVSCALGAGSALLLMALLVRIGVIQRSTYYVWFVALCFFAVGFGAALLTLPLGSPDAASIAALARRRFAASRLWWAPRRAGAWVAALRVPPEEPQPSRSALARDLALLFVVALGVRLLWVALVPPWQAPDEPDHFSYVTQLVEQGRVPQTAVPNLPPYPAEVTTSWGYSLFNWVSTLGGSGQPLLSQLPVNYDYAAARSYEATRAERQSGGAGRANPHPPGYYLVGAIPYALARDAPIFSRLFAVRGASAALGALSCVFAYLLAYELRRSRRWGWALGCCMALQPMYVFITATVNNDVGMDCAAAAVIWLAVRVARGAEVSPRLALGVGVAAGCALLTKVTVYPIVLIAGIVVLAKTVLAWRAAPERGARYAAALGACGAMTAALYVPWLFLQYHYTNQIKIISIPLTPAFRWITGMASVSAADPLGNVPVAQSAHYSFADYLRFLQHRGGSYFDGLFIRSGWGTFGWLDVSLADATYTAVTIFVVIGVVGAALHVVRGRAQRGTLLLLGFLAAQAYFLFVTVDYGAYANGGQEFGLQGRYFFPVLAPALYLLLSGWDYLSGENGVILRLAPLAMACLQVVAVGTIIARYYGVVFG